MPENPEQNPDFQLAQLEEFISANGVLDLDESQIQLLIELIKRDQLFRDKLVIIKALAERADPQDQKLIAKLVEQVRNRLTQ